MFASRRKVTWQVKGVLLTKLGSPRGVRETQQVKVSTGFLEGVIL